MVAIVHNDNKDWSIKKICDYIAGRNDDFEELGFSSRTIYNYLDEENRKLIDERHNLIEESYRTILQKILLTKALLNLEKEYENVITPYTTEETTIAKGQELPFIIKADPYKRFASLELDEKKARKLKGF